jgi:hypothetical protein
VEYRQVFPSAKLSLERATDNVPKDGRFHVILNGTVVGSYRSLKSAQTKYQKLRTEYLAEHPINKEAQKVDVRDVLQREMETMSNKRLLWGAEDFQRLDRKTKKIPRA